MFNHVFREYKKKCFTDVRKNNIKKAKGFKKIALFSLILIGIIEMILLLLFSKFPQTAYLSFGLLFFPIVLMTIDTFQHKKSFEESIEDYKTRRISPLECILKTENIRLYNLEGINYLLSENEMEIDKYKINKPESRFIYIIIFIVSNIISYIMFFLNSLINGSDIFKEKSNIFASTLTLLIMVVVFLISIYWLYMSINDLKNKDKDYQEYLREDLGYIKFQLKISNIPE